MPTNFQVWNPNQTNQESDAQYTADSQRSGGAVTGIFPSATANKGFYQWSAMVAALATALSNKGYTVNDSPFSSLVSVLMNIQTAADQRRELQVLTYSASILCDASKYLGFQIPLSGNTTITLQGTNAGDDITFIFIQDATGGRSVTWSGNFAANMPQPNTNANSISVIRVKTNANGYYPEGPTVSSSGMDSMAIGQVLPAAGSFSSLKGPTPSASDNSTNAATTEWVRTFVNALNASGFAIRLAVPGYIKLPAFLGNLVLQWGVTGNFDTGPETETFPLPFPTACLSVLISQNADVNTASRIWSAGSLTKTTFQARNNGSGAARWWAIGY